MTNTSEFTYHNINNLITTMSVNKDMLHDIELKFGQLVEDMNIAQYRKENIEFHFIHWHPELRILSELFRYIMSDLEKNHKLLTDACEVLRSSNATNG